MTQDSSAAANALGYIYQIPYALYLILEQEEDTFIRMEGLDDLDTLTDDKVRELLQLKTHFGSNRRLSDKSKDLWRSIRVWSRHLHNDRISLPGLKLRLITTSSIAPGSIASMLSMNREERDVEEVLRRLLEIASAPSRSLKDFVVDFLDLDTPQQKSLIEAIEILGNSSDFEGLKAKIIEKIKFAAIDHKEQLYKFVMGSWVNEVISHLQENSKDPISANAFMREITELGRFFRPTALPPYFRDDRSPISQEMYKQRFVAQLNAIGVNERRIESAIRDYMRSESARAQWLHDNLVIKSDDLLYDRNLEEKWMDACDTLDDEFRLDNEIPIKEANDKECKKFGQAIYKTLSKTTVRMGDKPGYNYVTHGSYHRLANETDKKKPRVWWHPRFDGELKSADEGEE